jgi:hypothetical protein
VTAPRRRGYGPERMLLDRFQHCPDAWRGVVMTWIYQDLGDLADYCATWYGTLPCPTSHRQESR